MLLRLFADSIHQPRYYPLDPSHYRPILSGIKAQKGPVHKSAYLRFRLPIHLPWDHLEVRHTPLRSEWSGRFQDGHNIHRKDRPFVKRLVG